MPGYFSLFVNVSALPAFVALALLIVRMPWLSITERLRRMLVSILFYKFHIGPMHVSLFTVLFLVSAATFADATRTWYRENAIYEQTRGYHQDNFQVLALKWRAERNFWLAFAATGAWLAVYRLNAILRDAYEAATGKEELERRAAASKKQS